MTGDPDAPCLRAYLRNWRGQSILAMPRSDWSTLGAHSETTVAIDVQSTPLRGVASNASVVAAVARRFSNATGEITIYRYDERDQPTPINEDRYEVWLDLPSHTSFNDMIRAACTECNASLREYLKDTAFLVKRSPGPEHWLRELPATVQVVVRSTETSR